MNYPKYKQKSFNEVLDLLANSHYDMIQLLSGLEEMLDPNPKVVTIRFFDGSVFEVPNFKMGLAEWGDAAIWGMHRSPQFEATMQYLLGRTLLRSGEPINGFSLLDRLPTMERGLTLRPDEVILGSVIGGTETPSANTLVLTSDSLLLKNTYQGDLWASFHMTGVKGYQPNSPWELSTQSVWGSGWVLNAGGVTGTGWVVSAQRAQGQGWRIDSNGLTINNTLVAGPNIGGGTGSGNINVYYATVDVWGKPDYLDEEGELVEEGKWVQIAIREPHPTQNAMSSGVFHVVARRDNDWYGYHSSVMFSVAYPFNPNDGGATVKIISQSHSEAPAIKGVRVQYAWERELCDGSIGFPMFVDILLDDGEKATDSDGEPIEIPSSAMHLSIHAMSLLNIVVEEVPKWVTPIPEERHPNRRELNTVSAYWSDTNNSIVTDGDIPIGGTPSKPDDDVMKAFDVIVAPGHDDSAGEPVFSTFDVRQRLLPNASTNHVEAYTNIFPRRLRTTSNNSYDFGQEGVGAVDIKTYGRYKDATLEKWGLMGKENADGYSLHRMTIQVESGYTLRIVGVEVNGAFAWLNCKTAKLSIHHNPRSKSGWTFYGKIDPIVPENGSYPGWQFYNTLEGLVTWKNTSSKTELYDISFTLEPRYITRSEERTTAIVSGKVNNMRVYYSLTPNRTV